MGEQECQIAVQRCPKQMNHEEDNDDVTLNLGLFSCNPGYIFQLRGILNILQIILGIIVLSISASLCQFVIPNKRNVGFICGHPDTFMFVISCCCLTTTVLQIVCCMISQKTAILLFRTSYEFGIYLLSFLLYLISSIALLVNLLRRNRPYIVKETGYDAKLASVAIGFVNAAVYASSAVSFFAVHSNFLSKRNN